MTCTTSPQGAGTLQIECVYLTDRRVLAAGGAGYAVFGRQLHDDIWHCLTCGLTGAQVPAAAAGEVPPQHVGHQPGAMVPVHAQRLLEAAWRTHGGSC